MCDADDRPLADHKLAEIVADQSKTRRERAMSAIELLGRLSAPYDEMLGRGRALAVLLGLLNDYDEAVAALRAHGEEP